MVQEKGIFVCRGKAWIAIGIFLAGLVQVGFAQERPARIPLHQALEKYLPANYQFNSDGVDLSTDITYDASLPWTEAFSKGLASAGLEMQTNLFKRTTVIKKSKAGVGNATQTPNTAALLPSASAGAPTRITIQQALVKYVPGDYGISIASEIDTKTMIAYDTALPWIEALGKGLTAVGLDVNANMYKKNIAVMPFQTTLVDSNEKQVPTDYKTPQLVNKSATRSATLSPVLSSDIQEWSVRKDDKTIRAVLERWSAEAGWHIAWEVPRKVPVAFDATFFGSFEMAVDKLMRSLRGSDYPLVNCQYEDNKVVRILRRGEIKKCQE